MKLVRQRKRYAGLSKCRAAKLASQGYRYPREKRRVV